MFDCIQVRQCSESANVLEEEGPLDDQSDSGQNYHDTYHLTDSDFDSGPSSEIADAGSPMDIVNGLSNAFVMNR